MAVFQVAIDGPAGSGKSTISKIIAHRLGMTHIDTGAMYRAVTLLAIENKIDLNDEASYRFLESAKISYHKDHIYIDDRLVEADIRGKLVTENVSLVSSFPYVRKKLVEIQKEVAQKGEIIMDGRDIGTVVMPNANLKIFLVADVLERAKRRQQEKIKKGHDVHLDKLVEEIMIRDQKDSTRKESPLRKAEDAIVIDTTALSIEQTVEKIIELIKKAKGEIK
ncbi:Cytidylate kinase [Acholeplasma oculi]|uniref:Cytidylate kinase n=1 Tax=Acholeplasma oculi TaxID=35623 RepID=A0A061AAZ7_9MOLU|nr:(d)CMP kinase [Acholeplasma oculi]CDR31070.1 Cytidylate kinase [Acholeplasma oculi]SKC36780.1 cytidylate kinase [Acholeplasma oculi]SUT90686.1 Cytidylate kinase [Acholeplasma oculi]